MSSNCIHHLGPDTAAAPHSDLGAQSLQELLKLGEMLTAEAIVLVFIEHLELGVPIEDRTEAASPDKVLRVAFDGQEGFHILNDDVVEEACEDFQVKFGTLLALWGHQAVGKLLY